MIFVYSTAPDEETAKKISKQILEKKLAACVNILPMKSMYWWKSRIENSDEVSMIFKTRGRLFEALKDELESLHPYEVPCICALNVQYANNDFFEYIENELKRK